MTDTGTKRARSAVRREHLNGDTSASTNGDTTASPDDWGEWKPYDWAEHFRGDRQPVVATLGLRCDGVGLFYPGRLHWLYGPYESGKTWLLMLMMMEVITAGRSVVVVDFDDVPVSWDVKLTSLGLTPDQITRHFMYFPSPDVPLTFFDRDGHLQRGEEFDRWWSNLLRRDVGMIVFEGVTALYNLEASTSVSGQDVRGVNTTLLGYIAEHHPTQPSVVATDHLTKPTHDLGGTVRVLPVDSGQKLPSIGGAAYRMIDMVKAHPPVDGRPNEGQYRVLVARDKGGAAIAHALAEHPGVPQPPIADLFVRVTGNGSVTLQMTPVVSADVTIMRKADAEDRDLLSWIEANPGQSAGAVSKGLGWKSRGKVTDALDKCVSRGLIETSKTPDDPPTKSHDYRLTAEGAKHLAALNRGLDEDDD